MIDDRDVFRCAEMLVEQAGEKAESQAAAALEALRLKDDTVGVTLWSRIIAALAVLRGTAGSQSAWVH